APRTHQLAPGILPRELVRQPAVSSALPMDPAWHARCSVNARDSARSRGPRTTGQRKGRNVMLHLALVFLVAGLVAGLLGMVGTAATAGQMAWFLFLIGVVVRVIHLVAGGTWRTRP